MKWHYETLWAIFPQYRYFVNFKVQVVWNSIILLTDFDKVYLRLGKRGFQTSIKKINRNEDLYWRYRTPLLIKWFTMWKVPYACESISCHEEEHSNNKTGKNTGHWNYLVKNKSNWLVGTSAHTRFTGELDLRLCLWFDFNCNETLHVPKSLELSSPSLL